MSGDCLLKEILEGVVVEGKQAKRRKRFKMPDNNKDGSYEEIKRRYGKMTERLKKKNEVVSS